ncbi:hypothetical protein CC86DRAFT_141266 [Ophiobolus disseminans]|uniref:Uncharacterized protein n=1 Tax=Ophiobolus disseminans TaxID=1469910 RepID=A0A6A7AED6_9PLEO|nr:hypothetical protein CC86DRAFT_141266 [Ophiobolus disseminans]
MLAIAQQNARASPLLRLPAEIRNTIYEHAFMDWEVRISNDVAYSRHIEIRDKNENMFSSSNSSASHNLLAPTLAYRQMHADTAMLVFRHVTLVSRTLQMLLNWALQELQKHRTRAIAIIRIPCSTIYYGLGFYRCVPHFWGLKLLTISDREQGYRRPPMNEVKERIERASGIQGLRVEYLAEVTWWKD